MPQVHAWKLRPGSNDKTVRDAIQTGRIRLDYEVPGLRLGMGREEIIASIQTHNPDRSDKGVRARAGQIVTLLNKVSKGDLALVPRNSGRSMMIGEVLSDSPAVIGTSVEVQVSWIDSEVPLSRFDQDLQYSFMAIHKFCEVSRNDAVRRLFRIAQGEVDPGYSG